ncbi:MAG: asparagine--tRNA ligase [Desulfobacteraceae bacterium 4572_130]|nr:MAG: asparagine--tRNA ligase [Desulfobacteraceae bacterium 4572_130]
MKRIKLNILLNSDFSEKKVLIKGWVRTKRNSKTFSFLEINDGSTLKNIQVIADDKLENYSDIKKITISSGISIIGKIVKSLGKGQKFEIIASNIEIISLALETYPLQKKRHSDEFLRTIAHLRPRTNKYGAVFRIRSELYFAIHKFYRDRGFKYLSSPIITSSDCEGAGEMFKITTFDPYFTAQKNGLDIKNDFFGQETNLTVSGQLCAEMFAMALGDVYTFGPTFRAENSNTTRHVAEFWMLEPEMAFCDLNQNMDHGEELIKYLTNYVTEHCNEDLALFTKFVDKNLSKTIEIIINSTYERITYSEAIEIINKSGKKFKHIIQWGKDLQSEHEKFLADDYFKKPVFITNYPREIKPFYMRLNSDNKTVAAMDLLVPRIGEIIGGSQREERLNVLEKQMSKNKLSREKYWWYLDSRRFGSVPHSGFGMGFERFLMLITGINNIRDVIPFPRTPGSIDF